jgi:hypothetical protein
MVEGVDPRCHQPYSLRPDRVVSLGRGGRVGYCPEKQA